MTHSSKTRLLPIAGQTRGRPTTERQLLLLSLDWTRAKDPRVPLGHASLLAALHAAGVPVREYSVPVNDCTFSVGEIIERIDREVARITPAALDLGIGAYVWNEPHVQEIMSELRRRGFSGRIILGGPQISYQGDGLEGLYPQADVFVRGYGEQALVQVMRAAERVPISGVHWAGMPDDRSIATVDLASLPSPFLTGHVALGGAQRFVRWETKRGCPYRCSFCQHREAGPQLRGRELAHERIRDEIALFARSGIDDIAVLDPIFNLGAYLDVIEEIRKVEYRGRLSVQCRFETLRPQFLDACKELNIILEFGLQTIHENEGRAIDRRNRMADVERAMEQLHERGIRFEVSLIFGLPNQTLASFRQSLDFCLRRCVPTIKAYPLMLLRGTKLAEERDRWGLVENHDLIPAVIESHTFQVADWQQMARIARALDTTSGAHPPTIEALETIALAA